jgi:hypothetical protein
MPLSIRAQPVWLGLRTAAIPVRENQRSGRFSLADLLERVTAECLHTSPQ